MTVRPPPPWSAYALVLAAAACFGTLGTFAKLVFERGGEPLSLLFVRFGTASLVLVSLVFLRGAGFPGRQVVVAGLALGATFYFGQSFTFFEGLAHAPAALIVLLFYVYPLLVNAGAFFFFRERLGRGHFAALALGLTGVGLTVGAPTNAPFVGLVLGLAAGLFYSGYILGGKRLLMGSLAPVQLTSLVFVGPALAYAGIVSARGLDVPSGPTGWGALAGVVVVGTILPTLLLFAGLSRVGAGTASLLNTAEPLVGVLLAYAVLGEALSPLQAIGGLMIVGGVVILSLETMSRESPAGEGGLESR